MCFGVPGLIAKHAESEEPLADMEGFKSSARELLRRIGLLEKKQLKVRCAFIYTYTYSAA